ncbi:MAG: S8 family serine peptidase [Proteobacteria bacterium]|nr:S8 family serine peptidase [Pseudomonadota bacterium]
MRTSLIILILLTSCGGGGGGGGGSSSSSSTTPTTSSWTSSVSTTEANVYKTTEYKAQWGLETINAAEAYALLAKNSKTVAGDGIKIAFIDSGVQTNHVEISGNYTSTGSYDYQNSDSDPSDDNGHGTHVASTAAGVKDSSGMHGVAYDATIIAEKVLNASGSGFSGNAANGITGAVTAGAKVINLSIGSSSDVGLYFKTALTTAKNSDVLSVAASGNDTALQPDYPAYYASDSSLAGYVLAVGALAYDGSIASYSSYCGDAKSYCLFAPGGSNDGDPAHAIYGAFMGSAYGTKNGTSMAAPHVAGAAAVIRGAWTFLTAPQVSQILLQTANSSFSGYDETIYGQGILDLEAAVQAQGQNTLGYGSSVSSGAGYDVATSSFASSAIFGDSFANNVAPQLSEAIFYDDFGRDYKAFLGDKITTNTGSTYDASYLMFNNVAYKSVPLSLGSRAQMHFNLASYKNEEAPNDLGLKYAVIDRSQDPQQQRNLNNGFSFTRNSSDFLPNSKFGFAFNFDEISAQQNQRQNFGKSGFILQNSFASNPYQSFLNQPSSSLENSRKFNQVFFDQSFLQKKMAARFSYQSSYDSNTKQNEVFDLGLSFKNISLDFGNLTEFQNNILNSRSLGAFESPSDVKTSYLKVSFDQKLTQNLHFLTSFSEGVSKIAGNSQGIFRQFDNVRSRSFSAALLWKNFGVNYFEPMRVYRGKVQFDIPVARDDAGNLTRYQGTASLAPKGREQDLEVFYLRDLSEVSQIKFSFLTQRQAGNVKSAPTNLIGIVSYKKMW